MVITPRVLAHTYRTTQLNKIEQVYLPSSAKVQPFKMGQQVRRSVNNIWTPMMRVVISWIKSKMRCTKSLILIRILMIIAHVSTILTITPMTRTHGSIMLTKTQETKIATKILIASMLTPMSSRTVGELYHLINILIVISIYRFTKTQPSNIWILLSKWILDKILLSHFSKMETMLIQALMFCQIALLAIKWAQQIVQGQIWLYLQNNHATKRYILAQMRRTHISILK
jgi:hypothetical protein